VNSDEKIRVFRHSYTPHNHVWVVSGPDDTYYMNSWSDAIAVADWVAVTKGTWRWTS
jgi:hypothetical protein